MLRGTYERASRDFDEYHFERAEEASRLEHGTPTNLPQLLRFDQAARDADRFGGEIQLTPGGSVLLGLSYLYNRDDYRDTEYGLIDASWASFTANADYTPGDRWNFFGWYSREDLSSFQRGRQSGGVISTDPRNDWTADIVNDVDSFGAGGNVAIVVDRVDLKIQGRYQKVDGLADFDSPPGGTPDLAFGVDQLDDTTLATLLGEVEFKWPEHWAFAVGGWVEDYRIRDAFTGTVFNYYPGSFFLATDNSDYRGLVGYVRLSYRW
jgi:hypothetical protein